MSKWRTVLALVVLVALGLPVMAQETKSDEGTTAKFSWFGGLRLRGEYNDNLSDLYNTHDDKISYTTYRANLGANVQLDQNVSVLLDAQSVGVWGESSPYRGFTSFDTTDSKLSLFRAYIEAKDAFGSSATIRFGRQPIVLGDEWLVGDLDFYGGTSFDGIKVDIPRKWGAITAFWTKIQAIDRPEYVVEPGQAMGGDDELMGLWAGGHLSKRNLLEGGVLYLFDHRAYDNYTEERTSYQDKRWTVAAHYAFENNDKGFYANVNAAVQRGTTHIDFTGQNPGAVRDINATGYEVTGGWVMDRAGLKNRLYAKVFSFSGDKLDSTENESFMPLFQDFHGRYGDADMWNGIWGQPAAIGGQTGLDGLQIGFEVPLPSGLTFKGMGQTLRENAQTASAVTTNRNLGQELAFGAYYAYSKALKLEVSLSQFYPGTASKENSPVFTAHTARRIYLNAVAKF